jgi:DNA-binding NarL/FixJ family response regulator
MAICVGTAAGSVMIRHPPLLIVDDCVVQRQCLAAKLAAAGRFPDIIFAATSAEAIESLRSSGSQLCLLSWDLAGHTALEAAAQIRREFPRVKVILIGVASSACSGQHCFQRNGAVFISRDASFEDLSAEVESPALRTSKALRRPREDRAWPVISSDHADGRTGQGEAVLTIREMQVLELIAAGRTNKEIAGWLHISLHTVKNHVHNLLEKMDLPSRHSAAQVFRSRRYGAPEG